MSNSIPRRFSSNLAEKIVEETEKVKELKKELTLLKQQLDMFRTKDIGFVEHCNYQNCSSWDVSGFRDGQDGLNYCPQCDECYCEYHMYEYNICRRCS